MTTKLKALSASAHNKALYARKEIEPQLLERFKNPVQAGEPESTLTIGMWEHIDVSEFTCLCPITGQPDFARIEVIYTPDLWCVESKSLKLYLGSFRNVGSFHEAVTHRICKDLAELLNPRWLLIVARFTPRGGIPFQPRAWVGNVPTQLLYRI